MKKIIIAVVLIVCSLMLVSIGTVESSTHHLYKWWNTIQPVHYHRHRVHVGRVHVGGHHKHQTPTPTPKPISTQVPPTPTVVPPTATSVPATSTAVPASATLVPPTSTTVPPTSVPPTVVPPTAVPTVASTTGDPSGQAMPTGDIPGWHQVFADNFSGYSVPLGGFSGCASATNILSTCSGLSGLAKNNWWAYPDGWSNVQGNGAVNATYYPSKTVSIGNGLMNIHLHTENGVHMVAALIPRIPGGTGSEGGLASGRYSIRFRADATAGYGLASLLWPDSEVWPRDGEIDYPEGNLDSTFCAYLHHQGATSGGDQQIFCPGATFTSWHTVTLEWSPGKANFLLDGKSIGISTTNVPNTPMHLVIQSESGSTPIVIPSDTAAGNLQFDWVTAYVPSSATSPTSTPVPVTPVPPTSTPVPSTPVPATPVPPTGHLGKVFIVLEENHNWSSFKNSSSAPYINNTLLPMASYASNYNNPAGLHPSLSNYLWLESGQCFTYCGTDNNPGTLITSNALHTQLAAAGKSWHGYMEGVTDGQCPTSSSGGYAVRHDPFMYYSDVNNKAACSNLKSFSDLTGDLTNNTVADYNFITPSLCDDGHDSCSPQNDPVLQTDQWLSNIIPAIMGSQAYKNNGLILITWDEAGSGDGPIGMIALSPLVKGHGYTNSMYYNHGSTLKTLEEIYGVSPVLGDASNQTDLRDLFTSFP